VATPLLKTALARRGHTEPLMDGTVMPRSFDFEFEDVPVIIKAFRRMVRGLEFDISELALTTYLCARAYGKPFTAIPVFPMRAFHHGAIIYNTSAGIRVPKDLEGKKVGVNRGYTVTTGLWARSILQHEHGVDLSRVTWVLSGDEHVAEYRPPSNTVTIDPGRTLPELLIDGEIAAATGIQVDSPLVKPLIPNARDAGLESFRRSGLYPINHTVVVKNDVLYANPNIARDLFDAFGEAKRMYVQRLKERGEAAATDPIHLPMMNMEADPLPYGIEPNRKTLEAIVQYAVEQKVLAAPVPIEQLFVESTRTLIA